MRGHIAGAAAIAEKTRLPFPGTTFMTPDLKRDHIFQNFIIGGSGVRCPTKND